VYAFLSPVPMAEVWRKATEELRPGSLLVSNSFPVEGVTPDAVIEVPDRRRTRLYLYRPAGPAPTLRTTAWAPRPRLEASACQEKKLSRNPPSIQPLRLP
jgi:hypothetical protein